MRKIRGFKLNLRFREIQRRAKKAKLDLAALGLGTEPALQAWLDRVSAAAAPAVLYDSFPADETKLTSMPGLAYSLAISTLGPDVDTLADALKAETPDTTPVFELAAAAALDEAVRFVLELLEDEAAEERCGLSPIQYVDARETLEQVLTRLEGHKIGVAVGEAGLRPVRSSVFSTSWLAKSKSKAKSA